MPCVVLIASDGSTSIRSLYNLLEKSAFKSSRKFSNEHIELYCAIVFYFLLSRRLMNACLLLLFSLFCFVMSVLCPFSPGSLRAPQPSLPELPHHSPTLPKIHHDNLSHSQFSINGYVRIVYDHNPFTLDCI